MRVSKRNKISALLVVAVVTGVSLTSYAQKRASQYKVHGRDREQPSVVTPGDRPSDPPSDAIILFDGKDLSKWQKGQGKPATWKVENGTMAVVRKGGSIVTRQSFGDCQLHIEWASPASGEGDGQGRGNSGIKFMGKYELQVLDSYKNITYADGQAGAIYGQYPAMVNASKGPGQWQSYEVIFRRPVFDDQGAVVRPASITAFHNGVLVQDHSELLGGTSGASRSYRKHAEKLPLQLQDHSHPVRYRNIWIRELPEPRQP
ncbi:MAG: DUF1080 domain-containing protein [Phycisphaeraceae bacterium]|nr:DUF1080 domain-containing protein [Phycisphaeraceae bacterium]